MTIADALNIASSRLNDSDIPESRREVSALLALALDQPHVFLIAHPEYELTAVERDKFEAFVIRRAGHEPFHYITGHKEFFGLDFEVTSDVLIPRPETEILVEAAIRELKKLNSPTFCEIGVGSGCISASILANLPDATAIATEISDQALVVAKRNAEKHGVTDRLILKHGDLFDGVTGRFDMIVSNPPYIPADDEKNLQPEVLDYEPHNALFAGLDGLDIVRRLVMVAPQHLNPGGTILIEIGYGQERLVREMFDDGVWEKPVFLQDLQGIARIVVTKLKKI